MFYVTVLRLPSEGPVSLEGKHDYSPLTYSDFTGCERANGNKIRCKKHATGPQQLQEKCRITGFDVWHCALREDIVHHSHFSLTS